MHNGEVVSIRSLSFHRVSSVALLNVFGWNFIRNRLQKKLSEEFSFDCPYSVAHTLCQAQI